MSKKILLTGAGGYIGSVATYLLLQNGYEVIAIDNFSTGYKAPLKLLQEKFAQKLKYYEKDLRDDLSEIFRREKGIEATIHFAACCLVDESMKKPQKYFDNNVCGSQKLLEQLLKNDIKKIIFSSTCAVYGKAQHIPIDEAHPTNPFNAYGESKLITEKVIGWYGKLLGLNYVILRYFNVCGASEDGLIGDSKKPSELLVQNAVRGALGIEPFKLTCPAVNTPDKTPIRDYINIVDLAKAHQKALEYLLNGGKSETINLGTGQGSSVLEVVENVKKVTGKEFEVGKTKPREGDPAKLIADIKKAQRVLNWSPKRNLEDSIKTLVVWYQNRPQGWEG